MPQICQHCTHFTNEAGAVERALPGLSSLSSAYAAVRGDDGICDRDETMRRARWSCAGFASRSAQPSPSRELSDCAG